MAACDEGQVVVMTVQEGQDGKTPVVTPIQMHSVHKNESKDNTKSKKNILCIDSPFIICLSVCLAIHLPICLAAHP